MIYPTRRAVLFAAAGIPLALLGALTGLWLLGIAWIALTIGLLFADGVLGASRFAVAVDATLPATIGVGANAKAAFATRLRGLMLPTHAEFTLDTDERLAVAPHRQSVPARGRAEASFTLTPLRRGLARVHRVWVRWPGPFGLLVKQRVQALERDIAITPNVAAVKDEALKLMTRNLLFGAHMRPQLGDSAEFHALTEFGPGMDRRKIDWKQSAKHAALLAREYRAETNQHIVIALDSGRLMREPLDGQPRLDRGIHAGLLLAYAALKLGDRVGLFAFDARPRLLSNTVAGAGAFGLLQRLAAEIDYSSEETNYTFALTQLSGALERRSLVVIFSDFVDPTNAELMVENVEKLLRRHLVIFVVFRDRDLEAMTAKPPVEPEDVSRAVIADGLLRQRDVVINRLRRMGVHIVDAPSERIGMALLNAYLDLKRRDLL